MRAVVTDEILTERRGAVLWVTFNRPEARNAMKLVMYERLMEICDDVNADDAIRAVVLTGAGEKAFVAGTDISEFHNFKTPEDALRYEQKMNDVLDTLERVRVPVIAAIRGACTGGGMSIANVCDLRVATPSSRFGYPVARTLGNCLSIANYKRLVDSVGATAVKEIVFLAKLIDARRAHAVGFLNEVVENEEALLPRTTEIADAIAGNAPLTLRVTKEALRRIAHEGGDAEGQDLILTCYTSDDFREGMTAFFEKRAANWQGK
ncbi:MAG: enoyl-CoA hydratase/isomerase family protein [Candidatus Eremiobacteraeota bacterium]|nr:enoyl-CoA hydratase/isomerase family protein [Candidatus Eremiobacteraeota bacterium]